MNTPLLQAQSSSLFSEQRRTIPLLPEKINETQAALQIFYVLAVFFLGLGVAADQWCVVNVIVEQPLQFNLSVESLGLWQILRQIARPFGICLVLLILSGCGWLTIPFGLLSKGGQMRVFSVRWAYSILYAITLLGAVLNIVRFEWSNTLIELRAIPTIGLLSYAVSLCCALAVIVLWRHISIGDEIDGEENDDEEEEEESVTMRILEEEPIIVPASQSSAPDRSPVKFWKVLVVFQSGLISLLLIVPVLVLPLIRLEFSGLLSELIIKQDQHLYLLDILTALSPIKVAIGIVLLFPIVLGPCACFGLACAVWTSESHMRYRYRRYLEVLRPALGSIVVAVTLLLTAYNLKAWSRHAFQVLCNVLSTESCLVVTGIPMVGLKSYVAHTVLLELFVALTLRWS